MSEYRDSEGKVIGSVVGLAVALTIASLQACEEHKNNPLNHYDEAHCQVQTFDVGDHIVSIPIDNPLKGIQSYEYHEGYKPVGISSTKNGSCILYVNDQVVEMNSNGEYLTGELFYGGFGYVLDKDIEQKEIKIYETTIEYAPGTHIISETINDPSKHEMQFEGHDGYEVIGISASTSGKSNSFDGACLLYVNTDTVVCEKDTVEFGTPKKEKLLVKEVKN